jgi:hypothetical protein
MDFKKLSNIDSRILYLLVGIVLALPLIFPLGLGTFYTKPVTQVFDEIESIKGDGVILLGLNYDASTRPEVEPMVRAVIRHAFMRNIKVLGFGFYPEGPTLVERVFEDLAPQYGKKVGVDYANFGYKFPSLPIVLGMGTDIHQVLPTDIKGNKVEDMPMMKDIRTYQNIDLIMDFTGSSTIYTWVFFAVAKYGAKLAGGVTGVTAAELYPLLQTKQLMGLLSGLKDAAEYEQHADEVEASLNYASARRANTEEYLRQSLGERVTHALNALLFQPPASARDVAQSARESLRELVRRGRPLANEDALVRRIEQLAQKIRQDSPPPAGSDPAVFAAEYLGKHADAAQDLEQVRQPILDAALSKEQVAQAWQQALLDDKRARRGMDSQAVAHLLLIAFIALGNIGYFSARRRQKIG